MKKIAGLTVTILTLSTISFAGNGDLIVDGKVGVGTASPGSTLTVQGGGPAVDTPLVQIFNTDTNSNYADGLKIRAGAGSSGANAFDIKSTDDTTQLLLVRGDGNVGIGTTNPNAKLHVQGPAAAVSGTAKAVVQIADDTPMAKGVGGAVTFLGKFNAAGSIVAGGYIQAHKTNATEEDTGFDLAFGTRENGYGAAEAMRITSDRKVGIGTSNPSFRFQVMGEAADWAAKIGTHNVGGSALLAQCDSVNGNIFGAYNGLQYAMLIKATGHVGIGTTDPQGYRLYVAGDAYSTGVWQGSDLRFKKNVVPINDSLTKVLSLHGHSYEWKVEDYKDKGFPDGRHYGVIAQEIEKVLPEVVNTAPDGTKAVAYTELIPVLIEAIKEQQRMIEKQQSRIEELERKH